MSVEEELRERDEFMEHVRRLTSESGPLPSFFDAGRPIAVARAPGRLDVLGGIADYSGSLVLELPLRQAAFVAAQLDSGSSVRAATVSADSGRVRVATVPSAALTKGYDVARATFRERPEDGWAAYVTGGLVALTADRGMPFAGGARLLLASSVPEGKGVSSSAAVEVASLYAVAGAAGLELEGRDAALLCQKAENLVVGAPCGVMDPMTACLGKRGMLLELLCQPATVVGHRALPEDWACFGVDSGVRHAVTGADYADVRVAAFMGYRVLADALGFAVSTTETPGIVHIDDPRWDGYLANATPSEIDGALAARLPERLSGAEFLARYGGTTDSVAPIDRSRSYPVRAATLHPIHEHQRVRLFAELLAGRRSARSLELLGELLYQSHASYSACGLGSDGTDRLVAMVRDAGPRAGLWGAKITGGGSGGTVAVLARSDALGEIERIAEAYRRESGRGGAVFSGSSAGAAELPTLLARL